MVPESGRSRTIRAMDLLPINTIDLLVLLLAIAAAIVGYRSGAIPQVLGLAAAGGAVVLIVLFAPQITDALAGLEQPARALVAIGGAFLVVAMAEAIGSGLGAAVRDEAGVVAGGVDSALGAVLGAGQALVVAWLVGGLLAASSVPVVSTLAQRSVAVRWLLESLPPPGDVIGEVGAIIDESGLPQVFSGLEPLPAPPVDVPGGTDAAEIAARAIGSTVRVEAQGCGASFTGTAFSIADGYFLTNAHVVAGAERVTLRSGGASARGTVVLFDPDLDVALVRAADLALPVLELADEAPGRGTVGAALGHPNGSGLTVLPAAVTAQVRARGRDLYGKAPVVRDILELRAAVEPGVSGGPLVLADGTVGGVVFAESRTDDEVGYALDPSAVAVAIGPGIGETRPVSTGTCIR
jgi:S1-C subfamily serine protease